MGLALQPKPNQMKKESKQKRYRELCRMEKIMFCKRLNWKCRLSIVFIILILNGSSLADIEPAGIFAGHMVLQRDMEIPVWGTADPGEKVTVSINEQTKSVTADDKGNWMLKLGPLKTGKALTMTIKGNNTITFDDILVGEVWICSGQSNMV